MLPDFPRIKAKLAEAMDRHLDNVVHSDPILSQIRRERHFEGNIIAHQSSSGHIDSSEYKEISSVREIAAEDVIDRGLDAYVEHFHSVMVEMP